MANRTTKRKSKTKKRSNKRGVKNPKVNESPESKRTKTKAATPPIIQPTPAISIPKPDKKWAGEVAAKKFLDNADFKKASTEFENIEKMTVDVDKQCKIWKSKAKLCESDYPILDKNMVQLESGYVNISEITLPCVRNVFIGQLPKDSEESFWRFVYEKQARSIHILVGNEDTNFFPQKTEDFRTYGEMWLNNRKTEIPNDDITKYHIEVLPNGNSNSIISTITVMKNWSPGMIHAKNAIVMKECYELNQFLTEAPADENVLIVSQHGAGRAGTFLALSMAVLMLNQNVEPIISEIVRNLRRQRPKAVETLSQYSSIYVVMFYFIKKKMTASEDKMDPFVKKSVALTNAFIRSIISISTTTSTIQEK